ncbi:MAG: alkaline phosphatase PhoX [Pseudomonadota bacterium]
MRLKRRQFIQSLAALTLPASANIGHAATARSLLADGNRLLDLPEDFSYRIVSKVGSRMDDGLYVPPKHDGMAAFAGDRGRVILVCNHEMPPSHTEYSAFGEDFTSLPETLKARVYDAGGGRTPGVGGTTTTVYDPATGRTERQHLSLAGTEINCAGGPTPWGSWLSCEECFEDPGEGVSNGKPVVRERRHGYVFEVPARASGLVAPEPLRDMGRFEHEACAVHAETGIVYMTEDRHHSLFYRYIPEVPGELGKGGRLQALALEDAPSFKTHNWSDEHPLPLNAALAVRWIDLEDVDPDRNDLRKRGVAAGAASFARGEGLCVTDDGVAFTCTIGGPDRLGQIFTYTPGPFEGRAEESREPGRLRLIAEAGQDSLLRHADNITMAPWGDLFVCEDTSDHCGIVGVRPNGEQYPVADNAYTDSELAGVCFSPDGQTLFVNIQNPGTTFAITGPWQRLAGRA